MLNRRLIMVVGVVLVALTASVAFMRRGGDKPKLSFTEGDLQSLENKLQGLEITDLEGLTSSISTSFNEKELDQLGLKIDSLSFDDLEGITSS